MATTVTGAFDEFMRDIVNLDPALTAKARRSRDWLLEQLRAFHMKIDDFPLAYAELDLAFGSFARRTKHRPLDDIDLMSWTNPLTRHPGSAQTRRGRAPDPAGGQPPDPQPSLPT